MKIFRKKIITESTTPRGYIDDLDINSGMINGWASSKSNQKLTCKIYVNNQLIKSMVPSKFRSDLKDAGIGDGKFGFEVSLPIEFSSDKEVIIRLASYENGREYIIDEKNFMLDSKLEYELPLGSIDRFSGDKVFGWLGAKKYDTYPYITANGIPCEIESYEIEREDVSLKHGLQKNSGFVAKLPDCQYGLIVFKLYAISKNKKLVLVSEKTIRGGSLIPNSISALFETLKTAKEKDSVGIVVWEGTHNPIGRAQVLFNVIKEKRPTTIITFDLGFSEKAIWEPLSNSDCKVLIIPWKDREFYSRIFKEIDLNFDLVWICKPRYPAFVLAKYISHASTRYIIDLDDNELEMSSTASASRPYGHLSAMMADNYIAKIPTRSVASTTLLQDFGGRILRHARQNQVVKRERSYDINNEIRVGFIGTVRPHKGVVEAAKAINEMNRRKGCKIKFVVGGIYDPSSLRSDLLKFGCEIHGEIDSSRLHYHLQNLDVIITGFPDQAANKAILRYQISSKIGDGLANGRPVLVPEGESTSDLAGVPGIYFFNGINFERVLENAIISTTPIKLDKQFTIEGNYQQFLQLEQDSQRDSPTGSSLFNVAKRMKSKKYNKKNVVLLWKQHDAGLYGRRIDHIARVLVKEGYSVTCLEIMTSDHLKRYKRDADRIDSDARFIVEDFESKHRGTLINGIFYKTIFSSDSNEISSLLNYFLLENGIYPKNTDVILFPAIPHWKTILRVFDGYRMICDIVDNQLGWEKRKPLELLHQYKTIIDRSKNVIFNSEENQIFFENLAFIPKGQSHVIPNWYAPPPNLNIRLPSCRYDGDDGEFVEVVYSGNMNDRFDWDIVVRIIDEIDIPIRIHLIGNVQRANDKIIQVLQNDLIIYHGPMREVNVLEFMKTCHLAIMPHLNDEHSTYMNPMKINMYRALGMHCISTNISGLDSNEELLTIAKDGDDFISKVIDFIRSTTDHQPGLDMKCSSKHAGSYIKLLSQC